MTPRKPKPPLMRNSDKILSALVHAGEPTTFKELVEATELPYYTVRNVMIHLQQRGLAKEVKSKGATKRFEALPENLKEVEEFYGKPLSELSFTTPIVVKLGGEPIEVWLRTYASKPGRTDNAKKQADMLPYTIAELFNLAIRARDQEDKLWVTQARLEDLHETVKKIIETYNRIIQIAAELDKNPYLWDARFMSEKMLDRAEPLDPQELKNAVAQVKENYGVPTDG